MQHLSCPGDFCENGFCGGCPDERFWGFVAMCQEALDRFDQLCDRAENPSSDAFFGQVAEDPFHQIQPR